MKKNELIKKVNELRELQEKNKYVNLFLLSQLDYEDSYYLDKDGCYSDMMPSSGNNFSEEYEDVIMQLVSALDVARIAVKEAKEKAKEEDEEEDFYTQDLKFCFEFDYLENDNDYQYTFELYSDEVEEVNEFLDEIDEI